MSVLLLAHTEPDRLLARPALEALAATQALATALETTFAVGFIGTDAGAAATQVGSSGPSRVLVACGAAFSQPRYATDAAAAEAICRAANAHIVVVPATSRWMRVLAGVAHRLGGCVDTHVTRLAASGNDVSITRWFYKQRIEGTVSRVQRPWLIALEPGTVDAWNGAPAAVNVEPVSVILPSVRTEVAGVRTPAASEQTVRPDADLLLVAGAGWTKKQSDGQVHIKQAEALILSFLGAAQASLGGSKSLVDQSGEGQAVLPFMTHLNQVGQTGASPRHRKGLATCCHGEEPHVVGWQFVTERRAVNLNPNCGWAQGKADVLYVADAFQVMAKVNELLASQP
ncbi:MAG: electron transfer flavoprotein subunit alpha [Acidobacteria bacterium]|nr:electron transfer flavoprotein subunit alpha [Acidobacteriota bacterium]